MSRLLIFIYGLFSYVVGVGGLAWFAFFIGGWEFLPRHIDSETPGPLGSALLINASLMLFLFHHDPEHADAKIEQMTGRARSVVTATNGTLQVEAAREG